MSLEIGLDRKDENKLANEAKLNGITSEAHAKQIVEQHLNRFHPFKENEIKFDKIHKRLYKGNEEIKLTPLQTKLVEVLYENLGKYVSIDDITAKVWGARGATKFTIRNQIKNVRDVTYYGIIKNKSNHGYCLEH